ncbi:MAG TPA: rhodanese-like domain-containing protein [Bryobacteraceae bacterium]|nr:rhodanese-like domain-containing protein [Bryobacteraceae bacterium]
MTRFVGGAILLGLLALVGSSQEAADPWSRGELLPPGALAQTLRSGKAPVIMAVTFSVLYHSRHLPHAVYIGPTVNPEGIAALKKAVANLPQDTSIVLYCGCCPMTKCPNIRPAYRALKEMGYTHLQVLDIPTNMHTDWYSKGYPSEPGSAGH